MFCPKCGKESSGNHLFCGNCGYDLRNMSAADAGQSAPAAAQPAPAPKQVPADWNTCFLSRWKRFLSSPIVLVTLVCATVLQVMSISAMSSAGSLMSSLRSILGYSYYDELEDIVEVLDLVLKGVTIYGIVMIVAMWLVFFDGQKGGPRLSTAGITVIQILQTIPLVLVCAGLAYIAYNYMELMGELSEYSYYSSSYISRIKAEINKAMLVVAGVGIFLIVFLTRVLSLLKSVKNSLRFHVPTYKGAMFVGVVEILLGLASVYGMTNLTMGSMNLSMILSLAAPFLYGITAICYRNLMKGLEEEYRSMNYMT